jgi:hypothetical protein
LYLRPATCGNGILDMGEQCDSGFQCNTSCLCAPSYCSANPLTRDCVLCENSYCGNGKIELNEQCDGGIGCDSRCRCKSGFTRTSPICIDCQCEPDETCISLGYECGIFDNGCKDVSCCGECYQGYDCINHRCIKSFYVEIVYWI